MSESDNYMRNNKRYIFTPCIFETVKLRTECPKECQNTFTSGDKTVSVFLQLKKSHNILLEFLFLISFFRHKIFYHFETYWLKGKCLFRHNTFFKLIIILYSGPLPYFNNFALFKLEIQKLTHLKQVTVHYEYIFQNVIKESTCNFCFKTAEMLVCEFKR